MSPSLRDGPTIVGYARETAGLPRSLRRSKPGPPSPRLWWVHRSAAGAKVDQVPRVFLNLHLEIPLAASAIILRTRRRPGLPNARCRRSMGSPERTPPAKPSMHNARMRTLLYLSLSIFLADASFAQTTPPAPRPAAAPAAPASPAALAPPP